MTQRRVEIQRKTLETEIALTLNLDGSGTAQVATGIGFLDHLLSSLARHARFDLSLACRGDLEVDDHHTAEDCGLALGAALDQALGDRRGIHRFGWALVPMDEALARAAVDLSGRTCWVLELKLQGPKLGGLSAENAGHLLGSLAAAGLLCLHVEVLHGTNDHHRAEAAFKAVALALQQAVARDGSGEVPSTKGVLG